MFSQTTVCDKKSKTGHIEAGTRWTPFHRRHVKYISFNDNVWILNNISLKYVHYGLIDSTIALF